VADWIFSIVDRLGAAGVGFLIFLENVVPPIPSELILPLAGFRARTGAVDPLWVWPAATAGSVAGALVLYGVGAWLGYERLHALAGRKWFVLSSQKDLEKGYGLFEKHGGKIVLLGRCVPLVRSLVSIPAGLARMPLWRFTVLTTIGSAVWNGLFIGLGWMLGENWDRVEQYVAPVSKVMLVIGVLVVVWLVVRRILARTAYQGQHRR
jgi:membrane protein DedA with SNARE-associated domain